MSFNKLKLIDPLLRAIEERGYKEATFIQKRAIPHILGRKNLLVTAKTGTGKTASYSIPIVQLIHRIDKNSTDKPITRALVITSTDTLSQQVGKTFNDYSKHTIVKHAVITNPDDQEQMSFLNEGVNVLIGTSKAISQVNSANPQVLSELKMLVLDEFDLTLKNEGDDAVKALLEAVPENIQTICYTGESKEEIDSLLGSRMTEAEKFVVKGKPKKGDKKNKKNNDSKDKTKNKDGQNQQKKSKKKKKKNGGGRRSTEMSDKLKAKFLWPLEK